MKTYRIEEEREIITRTGIEFFLQKMTGEKRRVHPHIHSAIEMLFIKSGEFLMYADDEEFTLGEGCVILFRSNTVHRVYKLSEQEGYYYVLKLRPSLLADFSSPEQAGTYLLPLSLSTRVQKTVWTAEEARANGMTEAIEKIALEAERREYGFDLAMRTHAASIALAVLRDIHPEKTNLGDLGGDIIRRIYDVILYVNAHYAENITAADCAARAFMSPSYFSRCFFRITGKSFKDYLNTVRINHAEKELLSSDKSVTRIAADCGFNNLSYFISVYKKIKGTTPKQAQKS